MEQKFRFKLNELSPNLDHSDTTLSKALLRVYLQPIGRLMPTNGESVDIQVNISARAVMNDSNCSGSTFVSSHTIHVSSDMEDHWEEWNITDGFKNCWNSTNRNVSYIEFSVNFQKMQCIPGKKKIPIEIVDPAVIPVEDEERRKRHWPLQPFVLVFLDNEEERRKLISQSTESVGIAPPLALDENILESDNGDFASRKKRADIPLCNLTTYHINFANLGMHNILLPAQYNARMCSGDCSRRSLNDLPEHKLTNHVRLIAFSRSWYDNLHPNDKAKVKTIPEKPKCVPLAFQSLKVTTVVDDSTLSMVTYGEMSATRCGCRA